MMCAHALTDFAAIRAFLETDRKWAVYALGDLDPALRESCEWYGTEDDSGLRALAMLFKGFDPPALFTMGASRAIELLLNQAVLAPGVYLNVGEDHLPAVFAYYDAPVREPMWRMTLEPSDFRPAKWDEVVRLSANHVDGLNRLYAAGGGNAFQPRQVSDGAFYGIIEHGELIAAAGTHVLSETYSAAAIGNVFTHPDYRGKGHAAAVTSAVCVDLIRRGIRTIGLNVARANAAAIRVYEKLGFVKHIPFIEGNAIRKLSNPPECQAHRQPVNKERR